MRSSSTSRTGSHRGAKDAARANLSTLLDRPRGKPVLVRVNGLQTGLAASDLQAVGELDGVDAISIPKVECPEDVSLAPVLPLHCLIESATRPRGGISDRVDPGVAGISLGEADLRSQTGALEEGLDWARGRIVNAAVAAGLPRPPQSVYPHVRDADGLAGSCRRGRQLGHLGRAAIHPAQLSVIEQAYLPTSDELETARATIARLEQTAAASALAGGAFVDAAMLGGALQIVAIAEQYGTARMAILIDSRYRGPMHSGNGGSPCG